MEYSRIDMPEPSDRPLGEQLIDAEWTLQSADVFRADFLTLGNRTRTVWIELHEGFVELATPVSMTDDDFTMDWLNAELTRNGDGASFSMASMGSILCIVQRLDFNVRTQSIFEINFSARKLPSLLIGNTFSDENFPATWSPF